MSEIFSILQTAYKDDSMSKKQLYKRFSHYKNIPLHWNTDFGQDDQLKYDEKSWTDRI